MPNYNPKTEQLGKNQSKFKSGRTAPIRVPEWMIDKIMQVAYCLDEGGSVRCYKKKT